MKAMYGVVLYTEGMAICEDDWEDLSGAPRCRKSL